MAQFEIPNFNGTQKLIRKTSKLPPKKKKNVVHTHIVEAILA